MTSRETSLSMPADAISDSTDSSELAGSMRFCSQKSPGASRNRQNVSRETPIRSGGIDSNRRRMNVSMVRVSGSDQRIFL